MTISKQVQKLKRKKAEEAEEVEALMHEIRNELSSKIKTLNGLLKIMTEKIIIIESKMLSRSISEMNQQDLDE